MAQRTARAPAPDRATARALLASLLVLTAVLGLLSLAAPAPRRARRAPPAVVLVGVPGLQTRPDRPDRHPDAVGPRRPLRAGVAVGAGRAVQHLRGRRLALRRRRVVAPGPRW